MRRRTLLAGLGSAFVGLWVTSKGAEASEPPEKQRVFWKYLRDFGLTPNTPRGYRDVGPSPLTIVRTATEVQVVNTTDEEPIFSYTVPANTLTGDRMLRVSFAASWETLSDLAVGWTWRLKFGGSTLFTRTNSIEVAATVDGVRGFEWFLIARNADDDQLHRIYSHNGSTEEFALEETAVDATEDQDLVITVEMDTADADALATGHFASVELL